MKYFFTLLISLNATLVFGQDFLNGSFELNNAIPMQDYINTTPGEFNALLDHCNVYGDNPQVELLTTNTYSSGPQEGDWFIGFSGLPDEFISLELSAPLVTGNSYTISFHDNRDSDFEPNFIKIGLSTIESEIGEIIYTTDELAQSGWTERIFTFIAPNDGQYITFHTEGSISYWTFVDNFSFSNSTNASYAINDKNLQLVQNPVINNINLKTDEVILNATITILSLSGSIVYTAEIDNIEHLNLDVSNLTAGFYILNVSTKEGNITNIKFIKT